MVISTRAFLLLALVVSCTAGVTASAAESPEDRLARFGLRRHGHTWIHAEEQRLVRLLKRCQEQTRKFRTSAQAWNDQIQRTNVLEKQLTKLETQYEENRRLLQQRAGNLVALQQLQEYRGQLSKRLGEIRLLLKRHHSEDESELYETARNHAAQRAELMAISTALRNAYGRLQRRYQSLEQVEEVQRALAELRASTGPRQELGTAAPYGEQAASAWKQASKLLHAPELPLLLSGGHVQVDILVDSAPATFVLDDAHAKTLVPLTQAERLGILQDGDVIWRPLPYGERQIRVCSATIKEMRIGSATLQNVHAYVTAAEHADLGARLGSEVLDQVNWKVDRSRAQIVVRPK